VSPPTILIVPNPNNAIVPSSAVGTTNAIQTLPNSNLADGPHENNMTKVKIKNINLFGVWAFGCYLKSSKQFLEV
jgi:hypothetical protein